MRLLAVALALLVVMAPVVVAGESNEDPEERKGCHIDLSDPTNPRLYGDCIIVGGGSIVEPGDLLRPSPGASSSYVVGADITVLTPVLDDCQRLCGALLAEELTVRATAGDGAAVHVGDDGEALFATAISQDDVGSPGEITTLRTPFD